MPDIHRGTPQEGQHPQPGIALLFDQNLSHELVEHLQDIFPGSTHVRHALTRRSPDRLIHAYARTHGLIIVTKNARDFIRLANERGHPPKTILIRLGNCTTEAVENLLRDNIDHIRDFAANSPNPVLELP